MQVYIDYFYSTTGNLLRGATDGGTEIIWSNRINLVRGRGERVGWGHFDQPSPLSPLPVPY